MVEYSQEVIILSNLGQRIADLRKSQGMTQEELAHRIGYKSKSAINKIELGGRDLPQKKIADIARALGVSPAVLMGWVEEPEPEEAGALAAEVLLQPEVYTLAQDILALDEDDRAMVKALVASLAAKTKKD